MKNPRPPRRFSLTRCLSFSTVVAVVLLLGFATVAYLLPSAGAQNQAPITPKKAEFVPGELLVRFRPGTTSARLKTRTSLSVATTTGRTLRVEVNHFGGSELVEGLMLARVAPEDTLAAINALRARADVAYAEPNFIRYADAVPNDPLYFRLWGLQNGAGISAETAWNTTTGSGNVVVGVIDTGIDIEHRDLKDNIFINTGETPGNNIDDDNNGFIDDVNGWDFINHDRTVFDNPNDDAHGTHVAGTIGAVGNNSVGVVGVNWDVQLLPLKAIGPQGGSDSSLLEAYNYAKALRQRGVNLRVLNNSYGAQRFSQSLRDAIGELGDSGILFVAAAGNQTLNNDVISHFPGSFDLPNVISVAASTEFGTFASEFSNRGLKTVHLSAPGRNIVSTTPRGFSGAGLLAGDTEPDGSTYSSFTGTSMATPHVAGAAALACAADPNVTLAKLRGLVLSGIDPGVGNTITGGRLNASKVVQFALENDNTPPDVPANFRIVSQNVRTIELRWSEAGDDGTTARASLNEIRFTDTVSGEQFRLDSVPALDPGTERTVFVTLPLRHPTGQLSLRTSDNVGNASTATVNITLATDVADPYIVTLSAPAPLTAPNSGTIVGPRGDDVLGNTTILPFPINFFGFVTNTVVTSSNGALYIAIPPEFALPQGNISGDFAVATETNFEGLAMVAGMWADLRTDRNPSDNVYMVQPDPDRVIFRWQGVTFEAETPVNFEIELRRDGSIQTRYGSGNSNLNPVIVGISGGDPEAYLVSSHSSENAPLGLTNAQTVTFSLRNPPPPPSSDLKVTVTASPNPVISGQNVTYIVGVQNLGPSTTFDLVMTDVLPAGTTFVSCTTNFTLGTCTGPAVGSTGTVTGRLNTFNGPPSDSVIAFTIVAKVTAAPGTTIQNTPSATSFRPDPNTANNTATVISHVVQESFFNSARAIAAGRSHTMSVRNDGTVWNWGAGESGQLGDGNSGIGVHAVTPVQVNGLEGVEAVADSNAFAYVLKADGTVWGWGINFEGQLGDGTSGNRRTSPVQNVGLTNVRAIDASSFYGAALKTDGTVWHWGASTNLVSDLFGVNTTAVQLSGIDNVTAIAAGNGHLLMLKTDKTVWAVGANNFGQLGDGTTTKRNSPVQVAGLTNVARIAAGDDLSYALKEDGTIWAWGINGNGQLGPGGGSINFDPHPNPIQVTGLPAGMTGLSAGPDFCLAIASDGTVYSWGNNGSFQLGRGSQVTDNPIPQLIPNLSNVSAVAAGTRHGVALKTDGSVWCWGSNSDGECGDGSTTLQRFIPGRVSGLEAVSSPSITPSGGGFTTAVNVIITCATPGATIRYTINGNDPTESDPIIASGGTVRLTTFTFFRARAWKDGLIPSGISLALFNISMQPPQLVIDDSGPAADQVSALDAALGVRDPFPVINTANLFRNANDPNTRVILFARNVELATGQTSTSVLVILTDSNGAGQNINAEDVRPIPTTDLTQVIFRLPNNLSPGTYHVKIFSQGLVSNVGTIRIKP